MEHEANISLEKVYNLPFYSEKKYYSKWIIIFVDIAKWIVLENEYQCEIFHKIANGYSIGKIIELYGNNVNVEKVLIQLEAKQIEKTNGLSSFEPKLHIHITNQCNLRCPHCYMKSGHAMENELSTNEIKLLCKSMYEKGVRKVSFTGGEPKMRKDFLDILKYVSALGYKITIFTNGCIWNEEDIKLIATFNLDGVQISLDGYDEQTNSIIRGKGSFSKALKTIETMINHGIHVKIAVTPPYEVIKSHGDRFVVFINSLLEKFEGKIQIDFSYTLMPGRQLSLEEVNRINEDYYLLVDAITKTIYGDTEEYSFVESLYGGYISDSCGYGSLSVMPNGDYYFCDRISDAKKIGNIRNVDFDELYNQMMVAKDRAKIDNFKPCNMCDLKYICGGGCRAVHHRDFTAKAGASDFNFDDISPRKCTKANKNKYYRLMIRTNEDFFE